MSGQRKSPSHHDYDTSWLRSWCDPNGRTADKSWLLTGSVSALKRDVLSLSFGRKRKGKNWLDSEFMKFYQEKLGCKNKRAPTGIPIIIKKKKKQALARTWRNRTPRALLVGSQNRTASVQHRLAALQKGPLRVTPRPGNSAPGRRQEN